MALKSSTLKVLIEALAELDHQAEYGIKHGICVHEDPWVEDWTPESPEVPKTGWSPIVTAPVLPDLPVLLRNALGDICVGAFDGATQAWEENVSGMSLIPWQPLEWRPLP